MPSIEPWLRGTETDVPAVARAVLHALQLADEDLLEWCGSLSDAELNVQPGGVAPVAFHIRHLARSVATHDELFAEFRMAIADSAMRVRLLAQANLDEARTVGNKRLPTTVGGLLVHIADHTQRHVGQAITTAKMVRARLPSAQRS
jgi:hypothetical protein